MISWLSKLVSSTPVEVPLVIEENPVVIAPVSDMQDMIRPQYVDTQTPSSPSNELVTLHNDVPSPTSSTDVVVHANDSAERLVRPDSPVGSDSSISDFLGIPNVNHLSIDESTQTSTHIIMILDQSGSMSQHRHEMVQAVNDFIRAQQETSAHDDCHLTLVTFNHHHRTVISRRTLSAVSPITLEEYRTEGCTALYDALGVTLSDHSDRHADGDKVIVVIVTDGLENSSSKWSRGEIQQLISAHKARGWTFVYLASDPMLIEQAENIQIEANLSCPIDFTAAADYIGVTLSDAVSRYRHGTSDRVELGYRGL